MSKQFYFKQFSSAISLVLDKTLSGAITPRPSVTGSDGNEEVLCIPQSSSITGTSPSDCLVSYTGHPWGLAPLQRSSRCIQPPQPTEQSWKMRKSTKNAE